MLQGGSKLERTRDLFEQALEKCPEKFCKPLFLMYAQLEEEHGLAKRAMNIYDRAASAVQDADKFDVSIQHGSSRRLVLTWHCLPDVHYLHRQGDSQLRPSRHPTHLPASHRSLARQADGRNVSAFRRNGKKAGRNRSSQSHLCTRIAVLRSENVSRILEAMEFFRK